MGARVNVVPDQNHLLLQEIFDHNIHHQVGHFTAFVECESLRYNRHAHRKIANLACCNVQLGSMHVHWIYNILVGIDHRAGGLYGVNNSIANILKPFILATSVKHRLQSLASGWLFRKASFQRQGMLSITTLIQNHQKKPGYACHCVCKQQRPAPAYSPTLHGGWRSANWWYRHC